MTRQYVYVGPLEIAERIAAADGGHVVDSQESLQSALQSLDSFTQSVSLTVTFVIGTDGNLRIADRHSEHVMCAGGQPVLSAGEMTLSCSRQNMTVERVTNQSTGYCPEPESWRHVANALDAIPIARPSVFDLALDFRLCPSCSQINIVKDNWFVCAACDSDLPRHWNFACSENGK